MECFFAGRLKRKPQGVQGRLPGGGFSTGWGKLYKVTRQARRLPTVVLLKDEKPKLNGRGVLPCNSQDTSPHCLLSMVGQNTGRDGGLKTVLVLPRPRVRRQLQMLARMPWSHRTA